MQWLVKSKNRRIMDKKVKSDIESDVILALKQVFDPEVPVNVYDLGLIYELNIDNDNKVCIKMTLTAPNCPIADQVVQDVKEAVQDVPNVSSVEVNLVFEPAWDESRMSEEALLELNML